MKQRFLKFSDFWPLVSILSTKFQSLSALCFGFMACNFTVSFLVALKTQNLD